MGSDHDQGTILVRLLAQCIQLSDRIVKGLFGKMTCSIGGIQDLVVEDGEIEGETEADLPQKGNTSAFELKKRA